MMFNTLVQGSSLPCTALYVPQPKCAGRFAQGTEKHIPSIAISGLLKKLLLKVTSCTELLAGGGLFSLKS